MAIRHRPDRPSPWQVYWNNPVTGRRESSSYATELEARKADSLVRHRIRFEPESFAPDVPEQEPQAPAVLTFADALAAYVRERRLDGDALRRLWRGRRWIIDMLGGMPLSEVTADVLREVVDRFRERGVRQTSIHMYMLPVKSILRLAEEMGWINRAPRLKIAFGKVERVAPPTPDELAAIHAVAAPHIRRVIVLGSQLGMRVGPCELLRLRWEHVDLTRCVVRVPPARKNPDAAWREVPIRSGLLPILRAWRDEDAARGLEYVVTWKGRRVRDIGYGWKVAKARAGITRRIRPYDLRHAFATDLIGAGVDVVTVARLMGHSSPMMVLKHYRYVTDATKAEAVERLPEPPVCAQDDVPKDA